LLPDQGQPGQIGFSLGGFASGMEFLVSLARLLLLDLFALPSGQLRLGMGTCPLGLGWPIIQLD